MALSYCSDDGLSDLNPEERAIRVFMAPPEVLALPVTVHSLEFKILPVLLLKICPVGTILVVVPLMIVTCVSVVIAPVLVVPVVGLHCERSDEGGAQD